MEFSVELYKYLSKTKTLIPYFEKGIQAGFPSPASDYMEQAIDLNKTLIKNPSSTFIGRISGSSMKDIGIFDDSLAIVDKSLQVHDGSIVIAYLDGGFTLKQLKKKGSNISLIPFNDLFKPILIDATNQALIWGKVTYIINKMV